MENLPSSSVKGNSHLYSFPFWVYLDPLSRPEVKEFSLAGHHIRLYPPFRSAPANFITMPEINPQNIPFLPDTRPNIGPNFKIHSQVIVPDLGRREGGRPTMMLVTGEEWGNLTDSPPMDSLRVDVWGSNYTQETAEGIVNKLIQSLRWRSNQWWIGRSIDAWLGYRCCTFEVSKEGAPLSGPLSLAPIKIIGTHPLIVVGNEQPINQMMWDQAINDIVEGNNGPSHMIYLLDSRYFAFKGDLRRSVLDMAVACEQARDLTYEQLKKKARGTDFLIHISKELSRIAGHSYDLDSRAKCNFELREM